MLLLVHEDLQGEDLEVGCVLDAEFGREEVDLSLGEGLNKWGVDLGFEEGVLAGLADVVVGFEH